MRWKLLGTSNNYPDASLFMLQLLLYSGSTAQRKSITLNVSHFTCCVLCLWTNTKYAHTESLLRGIQVYKLQLLQQKKCWNAEPFPGCGFFAFCRPKPPFTYMSALCGRQINRYGKRCLQGVDFWILTLLILSKIWWGKLWIFVTRRSVHRMLPWIYKVRSLFQLA